MTKIAAYDVALAAIGAQHDLEVAMISGRQRRIPSKRKPDGTAVNPADQKAADAFNYLVDNQIEDRFGG